MSQSLENHPAFTPEEFAEKLTDAFGMLAEMKPVWMTGSDNSQLRWMREQLQQADAEIAKELARRGEPVIAQGKLLN